MTVQTDIQANWVQLQGEVRRRWGKLTDDDVSVIKGDQQKLVGKIMEKYGRSKDEVERDVNAWIETL